MIKTTVILLLLPLFTFSQSQKSLPDINPVGEYDNISNQKLFSDSLASSFVIWIKKEVKPHKHLSHSEHVLILEGEGVMTIGNETFKVSQGDLLFIPKNTVHSLKTNSDKPVKVLSIQAPEFDGNDRVFVE